MSVYQTPGIPPTGLVLSRQAGETVLIRDAETLEPLLAVDVVEVRPGVARLRFRAEPTIDVMRAELLAPESPAPIAPAA